MRCGEKFGQEIPGQSSNFLRRGTGGFINRKCQIHFLRVSVNSLCLCGERCSAMNLTTEAQRFHRVTEKKKRVPARAGLGGMFRACLRDKPLLNQPFADNVVLVAL